MEPRLESLGYGAAERGAQAVSSGRYRREMAVKSALT